MTKASTYKVDPRGIEHRLLELSSGRSFFALYTSNSYPNSEKRYELIFGWGAREVFTDHQVVSDTVGEGWKFGFLGYELRTQFESVTQENDALGQWPHTQFFTPEVAGVLHTDGTLEIWAEDAVAAEQAMREVMDTPQRRPSGNTSLNFEPVETKDEYVANVNALKNHIQRGDIYEVNYCTAFKADFEEVDSVGLYKNMVAGTEAPFSAYIKMRDHELLCTSPERYIKREGHRICSQPIKGTNRYSDTDNHAAQAALVESDKERAENVMIVDLMRNDLSKVAQRGSVQVEELFGIYSFPKVHQMISTISAKLKPEISSVEAIKQAFPMGSMTGAPKVSAMKLIDNHEESRRGWYSGAVGYFDADGDFDFNVIIRSLQFNAENQYCSWIVGGAITDQSIPEKEYAECLLKAKSVFNLTTKK